MTVKGAGYRVQTDSNCDSDSNELRDLGHIVKPLCLSFLSYAVGIVISTSQSNGEE